MYCCCRYTAVQKMRRMRCCSCVESVHRHSRQRTNLNLTHGRNILNQECAPTLVKSATNALQAAALLSTIAVHTRVNVHTAVQPVARNLCVQMPCASTSHLILVNVDISAPFAVGSLQQEAHSASICSPIRRLQKSKQHWTVMSVIKASSLKHSFRCIPMYITAVDPFSVTFATNVSTTRTVLQNTSVITVPQKTTVLIVSYHACMHSKFLDRHLKWIVRARTLRITATQLEASSTILKRIWCHILPSIIAFLLQLSVAASVWEM